MATREIDEILTGVSDEWVNHGEALVAELEERGEVDVKLSTCGSAEETIEALRDTGYSVDYCDCTAGVFVDGACGCGSRILTIRL